MTDTREELAKIADAARAFAERGPRADTSGTTIEVPKSELLALADRLDAIRSHPLPSVCGGEVPDDDVLRVAKALYHAEFPADEWNWKEVNHELWCKSARAAIAAMSALAAPVASAVPLQIPCTVEAYESMARLCERDGKPATAAIWQSNADQLRFAPPPVSAREEVPAHDAGHPHLIDGEFQSDKYPTCPRGKVPLSVKDKTAQDLLWEYAQRRRAVDDEFAADLEVALKSQGYEHFLPRPTCPTIDKIIALLEELRSDNAQLRMGVLHYEALHRGAAPREEVLRNAIAAMERVIRGGAPFDARGAHGKWVIETLSEPLAALKREVEI